MRRRVGALLLAVATAATLAACTGKNAVDQNGSDFRYVSSTKLGTVIAPAKRKNAGNFTLPALSAGASISLSQLKGKVVLLNYWAAWCDPCKGEAPQLDLVYQQYKARGVQFVGIDTKDVKQNAQEFVKNNDISYDNVYDPTGESALKIGKVPAVALPTSVLIDKNGKVAAVYTSRLLPADLKPALNQLLAGK